MKKVTIEFEDKNDLDRFITLLNGFHNQLLQIEYAYTCDEAINDDMSIIDSVYRQLKRGSQ